MNPYSNTALEQFVDQSNARINEIEEQTGSSWAADSNDATVLRALLNVAANTAALLAGRCEEDQLLLERALQVIAPNTELYADIQEILA